MTRNPLSRDEKLLAFAFAVGAVWNAGRGDLLASLVFVAGIVLIPAFRRVPIPEWAGWIGLAAITGAGAFVLAGEATPWAWLHPVELIASAAVVGIPLTHFVVLRSHRRSALSRLGWAGIGLSGGVGVTALGHRLFNEPPKAALFVLAVVLLYVLERARLREYIGESVRRSCTLSATIIAKNEADRIRGCLDSIRGWVDEIVLLDSGSTDETVRIAREYTDRVYETDWPGYGAQKQRALEQATGDWVLSIDADEQVTPRLRRDIDEALRSTPRHVGYRTPWAVTIYGRRLDFGRSARAPLRLFRREGSKFTPAQVHETIELPPGSVGRLDGRLLHFTHRDYRHAMDKSREYAWLKSEEKHARGKRSTVVYASFRAIWDFFVIYVIRLGFLDGQHGLLMAANYAIYAFNKYAGLWTLGRVRPPQAPRP